MFARYRRLVVTRPPGLIRVPFALPLLVHVTAFRTAAQSNSSELIGVPPDTDILYRGDTFVTQVRSA